MTAVTLLPFTYTAVCYLPVFVFDNFMEFLAKLAKKKCKDCAIDIKFVEFQHIPIWPWLTALLRSQDPRRAIPKLVSITVYEQATWIPHFHDACLAYTILDIELIVQVLGYTEQFIPILNSLI